MAKLNLKVFKKGKPIYWIIGGIFLFVVFYLLFNRGSGSEGSGETQVVQTGPSESMQIAALQSSHALNMAQLSANVEAARVANESAANVLGAQVAMAQLASGEKVALSELAAQKEIAALTAQSNLLVNEQNISYALESARQAGEFDLERRKVDVGLLTHQLDTNADMFREQSRNLTQQALIGQVSNLKKRDRDNVLVHLASISAGDTQPYVPNKGGGFNPLKVISPIANFI